LSQNGTNAELREWAFVSSDHPLVSPGLGKRLRGNLYGAGNLPDGTRIKQTDQVVRADGLVVEFPSGNRLKLGTPAKSYRDAIDTSRRRAGRSPINWSDPFGAASQTTDPAVEATDDGAVTTMVAELRRDLAAERKQPEHVPEPARRGSFWFLTAPFAWIGRLRGGKKKKNKKSKAKQKGPSALPSRSTAGTKTRT
jgi:hypothetical protein